MQTVDHCEPEPEPEPACDATARRVPTLTQARRTSLVRAELALLERAGSQSLTRASRRPQALAAGRGVAPVRPLGRSLRIVHLAAAHERLGTRRENRPRLAR